MNRNIQLIIAYDGTDFCGWQRQLGVRTVQEDLENAIHRVVRHPVNLIASGRTDSGVHATGQVANFRTDCELETSKLRHAIGSRLPADASVIRVRDVPLGFHAMQSARSKLYRYRIYNAPHRPVQHQQQRYVYHYWRPLDVARMREGASHFVGTHDFKALASTKGPDKPSYVRTVLRCDVCSTLEEIRVDVQGTGFLYNQVRNLVGTLIEVGRGYWEPRCIPEIIASKDRQSAGPTAPAHGLCLQWVEYPPDHKILSRHDEPETLSHRIHHIGSDTETGGRSKAASSFGRPTSLVSEP